MLANLNLKFMEVLSSEIDTAEKMLYFLHMRFAFSVLLSSLARAGTGSGAV